MCCSVSNGNNVNSNSPNTKDISKLLANKIKSKNLISQDTNSHSIPNISKENKKLSEGLDSLFPSGLKDKSNAKDDNSQRGRGLHVLFHLDD